MITAKRRKIKKVATRRLGVESSETRAELIRLASRLIREEGCAAVTARRLAEELGLKRQIVHYYFGTIEDLFVAVIRRNVGRAHDKVRQQLESDDPLRVIFQLGDMASPALFEFSAMAMRSPALKAELQHYMHEFRKMQVQAIDRYLEKRGIASGMPPVAAAFIINSVAHTIAYEIALGVDDGHAESKAVVEKWLDAFARTGEWRVAVERRQG